jgi:hypothetical protein
LHIQSGFRTRNILCLPIYGGIRTHKKPLGRLLGVASLVNKIQKEGMKNSNVDQDHFDDADILDFKNFLAIVGIGDMPYQIMNFY